MLSLGLAVTLNVGSSGGTPAGFAYERTVTANNSAGTAKTDYPVKLSLTSGNFDFSHTEDDGRDIQFKEGATVLSHWIESWDAIGQTAVVWIKLPTIGAAASPTVTMLYGDAAASDTSDIHGTFIFGEDFSDSDTLTSYANFPDGTYTNRTGAYNTVLGNVVRGIATASGSVGTWNESVREQGNIVRDELDADANKRYKFFYTGQVLPSGSGQRSLGIAYSPDMVTWTQYASNPAIIGCEDPYVARNIDGTLYRDAGGLAHLFSEDQNNEDLLHFTSSDLLTWAADPANPVLTRGAAGTYDTSLCASPVVVHLENNNKFVMLYEGRGPANGSDTLGSNTDTICLARATSLMGKVWTKEATNPIHYIDVPDDLVWTGSQWILYCHTTGGTVRRGSSNVADLWAWDNTSLGGLTALASEVPTTFPYATQWNCAPETDGTYRGKITATGTGSNGFAIAEVIGSDEWLFERLGVTSNPFNQRISAKDGELLFDTSSDTGATSSSYIAYTRQLAITNNFQIMTRRKTVDSVSNNILSHIGFGSGVPAHIAPSPLFPDGYICRMNFPAGAGALTTRKHTGGGSASVLGGTGTYTDAEALAYNIHQVSYLSSGVIRYDLNGVQKMTNTDAAHLAAAKQIMLAQTGGQSGTTANMHVDWVVVRKYDGQDPTVSISGET